MLIEDDTHVVEVLRLYLEAEGFELAAVGTGEEGLKRFDELAPDLVVLDLLLPGIDGWTVVREGQPVELTRREFDLLWTLASSPGRVHTRDALYESVWEDESLGDLHTLEVHINRLRTKLETEPGPRYLVTVRGVGYKFEVTERA